MARLPQPERDARGGMTGRSRLLICALLAASTLIVYSRALSGEFLRGDDEPYVTRNPVVQAGLTAASVAWAFSFEGHSANWHPLTWLSHMLDVELYGMNPVGHHLTSVLFHVLNTLLVFLVLARATGATGRSALVAALFALHPLHVESVAWVAERKDVLSTFFWMLTLGAYVLYVERPGALRYLAVAVSFALGLLAKPMLVTLPCVLLLLDVWPLRRRAGWPTLVVEKLPLFALSALSAGVTFFVQRSFGAVSPVGDLPILVRLGNALAAYGSYIEKMFLPVGLAAFYPHPGLDLPMGRVVVGGALILTVTALVIRERRRPYMAVGWLWFLGTLVLVIGLVQVGDQAMADRYTYVPLIGLFVMVVWGIGELATRRRQWIGVSAVMCVGALGAVTWVQIGTWHDTVSLYEHALAVTGSNHVAENNLAQGLSDRGRYAEAAVHYAAAIALNPEWPEGYSNLGNALANEGKYDEAAVQFGKAIAMKNTQTGGQGDAVTAAIQHSLAMALLLGGKRAEGIEHLREAIRLDPDLAPAHYELGKQLEEARDFPGAIAEYREALRVSPGMIPAQNNLAVVLYWNGDYAEAWRAVAACRALGHEPAPGFLHALAEKLPDPGR